MDSNNKLVSADVDAWTAAEGTYNNLPLLIRFRPKLTSIAGNSKYSRRLEIIWSYSKHASGMPSPEDSERMKKFEDHLVKALEKEDLAILSVVITNDGKREWHWYTSNASEVGKRINTIPQEEERYPIQLSVSDDPTWDFYKDIVSGAK